jgi:hypothetical protein
MLQATVKDNGASIPGKDPQPAEQWANVESVDGEVCVELSTYDDYKSWYGTPKRARKLALAILRAADAAEVQP